MVEKESITSILMTEHGRLRELLARFIRAIERDKEETLGAYNLFKEKEKRHVFIEENKIFNFDKSIKIPIIKTLILQHIEMAKIVEQINKNIKNDKDSTQIALDLQDKLRAHTDLEEKEFYAILDKQITGTKKEKLINIIQEEFGTDLGRY
jgi:hemerythrin-like domain-containing protein